MFIVNKADVTKQEETISSNIDKGKTIDPTSHLYTHSLKLGDRCNTTLPYVA